MSTPILFSCSCVPCSYQIRSIGAELIGGGDTTNMIAWVNAYDITTVGWGAYIQGNFTDPSQTTPPGYSDFTCGSGACSPANYLLQVSGPDGEGHCTTIGVTPAQVQRSQYLLPVPTAYFVIASGESISVDGGECNGAGGYWFSQGCIYPAGSAGQYPMLVDLPIPDNTLDPAILVQNYYLGIINPALGTYSGPGVLVSELTNLRDLSSLTPSSAGVSGFGPSWAASTTSTCVASPDDPFDGDAPP